MLPRVLDANLHCLHVEFDRRGFAPKLRAQTIFDDRCRNLEKLRESADVNHVHQVLAKVALIGKVLLCEREERDGVIRELTSQRFAADRERRFVHDRSAGLHAGYVLLPGCCIERYEHVNLARSALITARGDANVEPRRQAFDV
jgi:hypothetical protein